MALEQDGQVHDAAGQTAMPIWKSKARERLSQNKTTQG